MEQSAQGIKLTAHQPPTTDDPSGLLLLPLLFWQIKHPANFWFCEQERELLMKQLAFLLLQTPQDEAQMHIHPSPLPEFDWEHMQLQPLFEPFEHQLDLPTGSIEFDDLLGRPLSLR